MKDKIELTRASFERWHNYVCTTSEFLTTEEKWQSLCAEAEKKEPIIMWAVVSYGGYYEAFETKKQAEDRLSVLSCSGLRIIKLVEEVSK
jgi:hypothetical protein